jgi:hypothetical protein
MDTQLLNALNNLSLSLVEISNSLNKIKDSKTPIGSILKPEKISNSLLEISNSLLDIKNVSTSILQTQENLIKNQETILNILKESNKRISKNESILKSIDNSQKTIIELGRKFEDELPFNRVENPQETIKEIGRGDMVFKKENIEGPVKVEAKPETIKEMGKESKKDGKKDNKEIGFFGKVKDNIKDIKDGISTVLVIAAGVLAIGMALKIVGQVDFVSIISLSVALPLIALAFSKISEMNLDPKKVKDLVIVTLGISTAIALSSFILSTIRPITLTQSLTAIMIAGTFSIIGFGISKFISSFSGDNSSILKSSLTIPILMVSISAAIAGSSYLLGLIKPIGLFQAITSIMIAGVFATIGFGISKIISSFKGIDTSTAIKASVMIPITLIAMSAAIAGSSYLLGLVKPIGLFQALTAILIAGVFTTLSYGLSKLISSFKGVSITDALKASAMMPIVMIAISASIVGSSYLLGLVKPIGLFQALTAILIAGTFTVMAYGLNKLIKSFKDISPGDALKASLMMPIVLVALSGAIMASSQLLSMVTPIGLFQAITSILIAGVFVILSYVVKPLLSGIKGVSYSDVLKGTVIILAMSGSILAASHIISNMADVTMSQILSFIGIGVSIGLVSIVFGGAIKILSKMGGPQDFIKGGISILAISATIALSSVILSMGDYSMYPSLEWSLNSGLSLAMFAIGAVLLGSTAMTPMFWVGLGAIVVTALVVMASSYILGAGDYSIYPSMEWSLGSGLSLGMFGIGAVLLGSVAMTPMFWIGLGAIVVTAITVVASSHILGMGDYSIYPSVDWALNSGLALGMFGVGALLLGTVAILPMFWIGLGAILATAGTIVATSFIIGLGDYKLYPDMDWCLGVGMSIAGFGLGAIILGFQAINPFFWAGLGVILAVAGTIVGVSYILGSGNYSKVPPIEWATSAGILISGFGLGSAALGLFFPLIVLGLMSVESIAETIRVVDTIFTRGTFKKFPSNDWVDPTLSIVSKFGSAVIGLAFALPLIVLGTISTLAVVGTIMLIDKAFSGGNYKKYPSPKWTSGVFSTLKDISNLLSYIKKNLGFGDLVLGAIKIWGVTKTIKMMDETFSGGKFNSFPNDKWNIGIKNSIVSMIGLMSIPSFMSMMRDKISSLFGGGVTDIAKSIVSVDQILSKGRYEIYPNKNWINGVASSLLSFIQIGENKSIFSSIGDFIKSGLGSSLEDMAREIVSIDRILSIGKFSKYPDMDWVRSIEQSFKSFSGLSDLDVPEISDSTINSLSMMSSKLSSIKIPNINKSSSDWVGTIKGLIEEVSKVLTLQYPKDRMMSVTKNIDDIIKVINSISISTSKASYEVNIPPPNWISNISNLLKSVGSMSDFNYQVDKSKIESIFDVVNSISSRISNVKYSENLPNVDWYSMIKSSISNIGSMVDYINKFNIDPSSIVQKIENILGISKVISDKISQIKPPSIDISDIQNNEWSKKINQFISSIKDPLMAIDQISIDQILSSKSKIESIISLIGVVSESFSRIPSYSNYPNQDWTNGVSSSIDKFGKSFSQINGLPPDIKEKSIMLSQSISEISKILSEISLTSPTAPNINWVDDFSLSISKISNMLSNYPSIEDVENKKNKIGQLSDLISYLNQKISGMSSLGVDNLSIESSLTNLERISMAFDKLASSVDNFTNSLENINTDKISSVSSITHSMVLLNTVGDKQFEKIVQKIEERSDRLSEAIRNYNKEKNPSEGRQSSISTPTTSETVLEIPEMKNLLERVETMTAILADISSVVGSRGALKNYIMSIHGEVTIGKK